MNPTNHYADRGSSILLAAPIALALAGSLLPLAASASPVSFIDDFEAATLDPYWNNVISPPRVSLSSSVSHSGSQSLRLDSVAGADGGGGVRSFFGQPTKGEFSVWVYDSAAGQGSNRYFQLAVGSLSDPLDRYAIGMMDWDGGTYYWDDGDGTPGSTGVPRTLGWHFFQIKVGENDVAMFIDNTEVLRRTGDLAYDYVSLHAFGPSWRPTVSYWIDDFSASLPGQVPDGGSTAAALGLGVLGLTLVRSRHPLRNPVA